MKRLDLAASMHGSGLYMRANKLIGFVGFVQKIYADMGFACYLV